MTDDRIRHLRVFYLSDATVMALLEWGDRMPEMIQLPVATNIPPGASMHHLFADYSRRAIGVVVEHESFPPHIDGAQIAHHEDPLDAEIQAIPIVNGKGFDCRNLTVDDLRKVRKMIDERIYDVEHGR